MFNFNACNFKDINRFLAIVNITSKLNYSNTAVSKFYEILTHSFDLFVTKSKINPNHSHDLV